MFIGAFLIVLLPFIRGKAKFLRGLVREYVYFDNFVCEILIEFTLKICGCRAPFVEISCYFLAEKYTAYDPKEFLDFTLEGELVPIDKAAGITISPSSTARLKNVFGYPNVFLESYIVMLP